MKARPNVKYVIKQRAKNGNILCMEVEASPIRRRGKIVGLLGIMKDITEYKKAEKKIRTEKKKSEDLIGKLNTAYKELKETQDELIRRERMATAGTFAAGIAHEVRNPLVNLSMSAEQLRKIIKPNNPKFKHIDIIKRNTDRINFLITELLNCARPSRLNPHPCNMHKILGSIIETMNNKIRLQKVKVVKNFTHKSPILKLDREYMERVFLNIINNAIDAMSKGGKLTIVTEFNGESFMIKIQDTGKGIPQDDIMRIFDPFFSTKQEGVGLGLTICYGIIASHGGTIEVESKPKKGSTFTISLPHHHHPPPPPRGGG
ncbi:MAG: ATP-binding protein, partial [Candidatus Omnitrophica bacterium]|nr:ATP-binding protein [Candidatus Omnitrophota bacterium]